MFEAQLNKASTLKKIIDSIKDLITDAPFDCSESAISLQAMDASHVALVSLRLSIDMFETYRCDRTVSLGLNLANVTKALKCANNDDVCVLRFEDHDQDNIVFEFHDTAKTKNQQITIKLMDIDSEHLGIPDQKYAATICMSSSEFAKTCRDLAQFSDSLTIACVKGSITLSGKGDTGSNIVSYNGESDADNDGNMISFEVNENVTSTFSIKYMLHFAKAAGLHDKVRLSLSEGVPVVVEYKIEETGWVRYYLAPKIDEDADMD